MNMWIYEKLNLVILLFVVVSYSTKSPERDNEKCAPVLFHRHLFYYKILWKGNSAHSWYCGVRAAEPLCRWSQKASFIYGTGLLIIFLILPWACTRDFFTEFQYIRVEMTIVSEMAKVTMLKKIPNTAPGRLLRPKKYETNLDLIWKHDNCICVRITYFVLTTHF